MLAAVGGAVSVLLILAVVGVADSLYTSIRREDCRPPAPEIQRQFADRDLGVHECPAPGGWRLLFVASQANSWLEIHGPRLRWSAERDIVYDRPIGLFPNVGGSPVVEWRRDDHGRFRALIFRVLAQDPASPERMVWRLYVVRLEPETACVIGRVVTNDAARTLADSPQDCARVP